jgi:TonB family protein
VISWREGVLISIIVHLTAALFVLAWPRLFPYDPAAARRLAASMPIERQDSPRFVFVQPRVDTQALKPPVLGEASDKNRVARAPERAPTPANPLPLSKGNTPERIEENSTPREVARGRGPEPDAGEEARTQPQPSSPVKVPESQSALLLPGSRDAQSSAPQRPLSGGLLGDALRNLQRSMQNGQFDNPQGGGGTFGPGIQFDTKGVEFGPWLRRFVEQVKRNWEPLIPSAAAYMKGHVVVTFNIHKDGTITELQVVAPSSIDGFTNAAYGAMRASNPTYPLPPEYPSDQAFFTVTFFYNEQPPQ